MAKLLPEQFTAGTTFRFYAGKGASLYLRGKNFSATLTSDADGYLVAPVSETKTWKKGVALYSLTNKNRFGDTVEVSRGNVEVRPDISQLTPGQDVRSQNRRIYDAICAVLENRASRDQQEYKIGHRELKRMPIDDLLKLRNRYATFVAEENGRSGFLEHKVVF